MSLSKRHEIKVRLPFLLREIGQQVDGLFDCILQVGDTQIKCNRFLLAKNSKWFYEYFEAHPKPGPEFTSNNVVVVHINNIQPKYVINFMDILYKNYLRLDIYNIPHLLKIADYYKFPHITRILRTFYIDASKDNRTLMHFAKTFIENGLVNDAISLAEKISQHFINAEKQENVIFTIAEIYDALSPPVFAAVLKERQKKLQKIGVSTVNDETTDKNELKIVNESIINNINRYKLVKEPISDLLVVKYIEDFVKNKGISTLTDDDKESLAEVLKSYTFDNLGLDGQARSYMLKYDCDWFPARYARKQINEILKKRKEVLINIKRKLNNLNNETITNRWFVMSLVKNVKNADSRPEDTPVIEFIRTLGGAVNPFNPVLHGFINIESTKPCIDKRKPEYPFIQNPDCYFFAVKDGNDKNPYIGFDLGKNVSFNPTQLYFDSRASFKINKVKENDFKQNLKDTRSHVSKLNVTFGSYSDIVHFADPTNPTFVNLSSRLRKPFSNAKFELVENDKGPGSDTFCLTTLEVFGNFE